MARIKAAGFEDRMTLIEHLDELRGRIIFAIGTVVVVAIVCFWQNDFLLNLANGPLPDGRLADPVTFSPTEPLITTLTVVLYAALLISFPILTYQLYAYVLPAFTPSEKRTVLPLLLMVPFLFVGGVVFGYLLVMPAAIDFLLNFNQDNFNVQIRAREYYGFFALTLFGIGILFQIPVAILAATRLGVVTPDQLSANRRYAILVIAVLAMLLPGGDPITMLILMAPLILLYEFSIIMARTLGGDGEPAAEPAGESARGREDESDPLG
jgi:sec-independent protein translocase protein TatC